MPSSSQAESRDFELQLGPATADGYQLALRSPAGETRGTFALPPAGARVDEPPRWTVDGDAAREMGECLFEAVFSGDALSLYDTSRALARRDGSSLRLRLRILAPELAVLPWELLYDARAGEFVGLSQQTRVVRTVETMEPLPSLAVTLPLRILGVAASPADLPALDVAREQALLAQAVASSGGHIELAWSAGGSWRDLQARLQEGPWHILHFVGHGLYDDTLDEAAVALVGEDGRADLRNAQEIARLVADQPALRLVVLNACDGAHAGTQALYASLAEHLVRRGLPAVLAMQSAIADTAALEFSRSFYAALGNALPVDAACTEARKAMSLAAPYSPAWAIPVLFMRSPDGQLWTRPAEAGEGAMDADKTPWWQQVSNSIGKVDAANAQGDVIIAVVGAGARNVAAGKNIRQTVNEVLGPPAPDDAAQIEQGFTRLSDALGKLGLDAGTADRGQTRIELLQEELSKPDDETPNASTITNMGDWLLKNVSGLREPLAALFALPAVGRVMGRAGEAAVRWVQDRFGKG